MIFKTCNAPPSVAHFMGILTQWCLDPGGAHNQIYIYCDTFPFGTLSLYQLLNLVLATGNVSGSSQTLQINIFHLSA